MSGNLLHDMINKYLNKKETYEFTKNKVITRIILNIILLNEKLIKTLLEVVLCSCNITASIPNIIIVIEINCILFIFFSLMHSII